MVDAMRHAWHAYRTHAWGYDHLLPVSQKGSDWLGLGLTIVDSLDTLLIMGLSDEYAEAVRWIGEHLNFNQTKKCVSLFETTIRVLGGLLSAYHLSGDRLLIDKSIELGELLAVAFEQSPSNGIPHSHVCLNDRRALSPHISLAEAGSLQLEFRELSRLSGQQKFEKLSFQTNIRLHSMVDNLTHGLYPSTLSAVREQILEVDSSDAKLGGGSDSFYEYLLKQWLQTGRSIDWLADDYQKAIVGVKNVLWKQSLITNMSYVGEMLSVGQFSHKMEHLVCFLAGTLALGHYVGKMPSWHLEMAENLTETCVRMWIDTPTHLAPEAMQFHQDFEESVQDLKSFFSTINSTSTYNVEWFIESSDSSCYLRPETVESLFYMYRITGNKKYRQYGWRIFQAIETSARVPVGGYSSVGNVMLPSPVILLDKMESFFLSETLKYLYLLFDDTQPPLFPLDQWVFNTEAHPLPTRAY